MALSQLGLMKDWKRVEGGIYITLREGLNIDHLLNIKELAGGVSMDVKDYLISGVSIIPRGAMRSEHVELYRKLKGLECTIRYGGLLRNRPIFVSRPALRLISDEIKTSDYLVNKLNNDRELMRLIKYVKPSDLRVLLKSVDEAMHGPEEDLLEAEREYYRDPREITWVIVLGAVFVRGLSYRKKIESAIGIIDRVAQHLKFLR